MPQQPFTFNQKDDLSFTFIGTIPSTQVASYQNQALSKLQQKLNLPGFRPGKVPLNLVATNYESSTILSESLNIGLTDTYSRLIKEHNLSPAIPPHVDFKTTPTLNGDWQVTFESCLSPQVKLDPKYLPAISKLKKLDNRQQNIDAILALVEKHTTITFPPILGEHEWEHYLEEHQVPKDKQETVKKDYIASLKRQWLINLALSQIGTEHKIQLAADDLKNVSLPPELIKNNPQLAVHLLLQDKIVSFLIEKLAQS